jgi:SAM-dependent methyltransferase
MSRVLQHIDVGVEPNRHLLTRAAETGVYSRLEQRPAEATNLPDASVATIVSNSVLEHMRHVGMVLTEIARVLQPGGTFMFTTPTSHFSSMLLLPLPGYVVWRNREMYNVNLWPITQWIDALHASGFKVEQVQPYLRPELVRLWDTLEILHQIWVRRRRLLGIMWRRIPPRGVARLAERLSQTNLAAPTTAGGQLIVARRQLEGSHGSIYSL